MTQAPDADLTLVHEPTPEGQTRVKLVRDGREISGAFVVPMTVMIGIAPVRMDGIGGVETDENYRYKGYSRRVLEACIAFMKQGDAPLTTLYGIPSFYPKFGYATLGPEPVIALRRDDIPELLPEGFATRPMQPGDLPAVRALYDAGMGQSIGPLVRDGQTPSWGKLAGSLARNEDEARVLLDASGAIVAYAWRASWSWWMGSKYRDEPDALRVSEAFAATPQAADALLGACRAWAAERGVEAIEWMLPPDGRIGMAAALRGAAIRLHHSFEGEYMGRALDLLRLFRALQPELERRWAAATPPWRGRLVIDTGDDRAALTLGDGWLAAGSATAADAAAVPLSAGDVARLVFGSFDPREVLARVGIGGPQAEALAVLFPQGFPYIYPADRF